MKFDSLKKTFLAHTGMHFIFDHSEKIATGCFVAGHLGLISQAGLSPDLTTAAGAFFIVADTYMSQAKKNPVATFRICSLLGVAGALCLSASGFNFHAMHADNMWRIISPLSAFPTMAIMGLQHEIAERAAKHTSSKNSLVRAFSNVCRYPLLLGAAIGVIGGAGLAMSALVEQNVPMLAVLALWSVGGCGMVLSDPRIQTAFKGERERAKAPLVVTAVNP